MMPSWRRVSRNAPRSITSRQAAAITAVPSVRNCVSWVGLSPASISSLVRLPFAPKSNAARSA